MGEVKHTPGPHVVEQRDHLGDPAYAVKAADGVLLAVGCTRQDATLFSAAPEMFEAATAVVASAEFHGETSADLSVEISMREFEALRAALSKAGGA